MILVYSHNHIPIAWASFYSLADKKPQVLHLLVYNIHHNQWLAFTLTVVTMFLKKFDNYVMVTRNIVHSICLLLSQSLGSLNFDQESCFSLPSIYFDNYVCCQSTNSQNCIFRTETYGFHIWSSLL